MKRWHKSMKRKPKVGEDIIIIWNDKTAAIGIMLEDEFGEAYLSSENNIYSWETASDMIKQWAYVDKYFEKELNGK